MQYAIQHYNKDAIRIPRHALSVTVSLGRRNYRFNVLNTPIQGCYTN